MKKAKDLIDFCISKLGTAYVYGAKGEVLAQARYDWLKRTYPSYVPDSDRNKIGKWCVDCSGLISWFTGRVLGSAQLYAQAIKRGTIATIKNAPVGAILWKSGHVGVYIGNGMCIEAKGSAYGTVKTPVSGTGANKWTHWLLMDYIDYGTGTGTETETITPPSGGSGQGNNPENVVAIDTIINVMKDKNITADPEYWAGYLDGTAKNPLNYEHFKTIVKRMAAKRVITGNDWQAVFRALLGLTTGGIPTIFSELETQKVGFDREYWRPFFDGTAKKPMNFEYFKVLAERIAAARTIKGTEWQAVFKTLLGIK